MWWAVELWIYMQVGGALLESVNWILDQLRMDIIWLENIWDPTRELMRGMIAVEIVDRILYICGEDETVRMIIKGLTTTGWILQWITKMATRRREN